MTDNKHSKAEEILNRLGEEREITFWDAYILKKDKLFVPSQKISRSNELGQLILDAMEEYVQIVIAEKFASVSEAPIRIFFEGKEMKSLQAQLAMGSCSWGFYIEQLNIIAARSVTDFRLSIQSQLAAAKVELAKANDLISDCQKEVLEGTLITKRAEKVIDTLQQDKARMREALSKIADLSTSNEFREIRDIANVYLLSMP